MEALGFSLRQEAGLETLTLDIVKTSEIEGETLNAQQVRSSIARRLGIDIAGAVPSDRNVEGVVEMMLDATLKFERLLSAERLFGWHAALFPTGHSGIQRITVGGWRDDAKGQCRLSLVRWVGRACITKHHLLDCSTRKSRNLSSG